VTGSGVTKVPALTASFWVIKILATTLGETGGDAVSMSLGLGYLAATAIFLVGLVLAVAAQIAAPRFHSMLYWTTIVATTTVGTTLADLATRSLGIGYAGGSTLLFALLMGSLALWRGTMGSVAVDSVSGRAAERFYWVTILFSQTLGTALGDWTSDSAGFGYAGSAVAFGALLALVAAAYFLTDISHTALFWSAFILTRPLGAVLGDLLDKPVEAGGMALSRYAASGVLLVFIVLSILIFPQRASERRH